MNRYLTAGLISLVIIIITGTLISKCVRNKKIDKHEEVRLDIINYDLVNTDKAKRYQDSVVKRNKALELALSKKEIQYVPIRIEAKKAVKTYEKQPTIQNCDNAVIILKTQNILADSIISDLKQIGVNKDTLLASKDRLISVKDTTIGRFNKAYIRLQNDYKKAAKPRRFGLGMQAGYGIDKTLTPTPYIGIGVSMNIIRF